MSSSTSRKGFKHALPTKPCARCGRLMSWRKAWAKTWSAVRYCSERCRRSRSPAAAQDADSFTTGAGRP